MICVREHTKDSILANADARLGNAVEQEIETALGEIAKIARLRLEDAPVSLSTHVLDTVTGRPAAGVAVELRRAGEAGRVGGDRRRRPRDVRRRRDGRSSSSSSPSATTSASAPFLDRVPLRFTIADAGAHYHVPLLVSPWAYSTYRGS